MFVDPKTPTINLFGALKSNIIAKLGEENLAHKNAVPAGGNLDFSLIKTFLFDLDGTLTVDGLPIPGAAEALTSLKAKGLAVRICTNTTTMSRDTMSRRLRQIGLPIEPAEVFSAPSAAAEFLRQHRIERCLKLLSDDVKHDFVEFEEDDSNPERIVIGDIGGSWDYALMSKLFSLVMNGSKIIALHKGRYWLSEGRLKLDIGAFITGLEYATCVEAQIIGKPSTDFYKMALASVKCSADEACMIGDDLINDIQGAQNCGIKGILVKTGKYLQDKVSTASIKPDLIVASVVDLPDFLA